MKFIFLLVILSLVSLVSLGAATQYADARTVAFNERATASGGGINVGGVIYHNGNAVYINFIFGQHESNVRGLSHNELKGYNYGATNGASVAYRVPVYLASETQVAVEATGMNEGLTKITFPAGVLTHTSSGTRNDAVSYSFVYDSIVPKFKYSSSSRTSFALGNTIPALQCTDTNPTTVTNNAGSTTFDAEGAKTVTYTCTDAAGNRATQSVSYSVGPADTTRPAFAAGADFSPVRLTVNDPSPPYLKVECVDTYRSNEFAYSTQKFNNVRVYGDIIINTDAPGEHRISYSCTDTSSNRIDGAKLYRVYSTPAIPIFTNSTAIVSSSPPTITLAGIAEADSTVTLYKDETFVTTVTATTGGNFEFTGVTLDEGINSFTATATDASSNVSAKSGALMITLDTAAPAIPIFTNSTAIVSSSPITLAGIAEADSTVTLYKGETFVTTVTATTGGNFEFTGVTLDEESNSFTATATDASSNVSAKSGALVITLDTTAPADTTALTTATFISIDPSYIGNPTNLKAVPKINMIDFAWNGAFNWDVDNYLLQYKNNTSFLNLSSINNANITSLTQNTFPSIYDIHTYRIQVDGQNTTSNISNEVKTSAFVSVGSFTPYVAVTTYDVNEDRTKFILFQLDNGAVSYTGQYTVSSLPSLTTLNGGTLSYVGVKPMYFKGSSGPLTTNCDPSTFTNVISVNYARPLQYHATDSFVITLEKVKYRLNENAVEGTLLPPDPGAWITTHPAYLCELTGEKKDVTITLNRVMPSVCEIVPTTSIEFGDVPIGQTSSVQNLAFENTGNQPAAVYISGDEWQSNTDGTKVMDVSKTRHSSDQAIKVFDDRTELTIDRVKIWDAIDVGSTVNTALQLIADLVDSTFRGEAQQTITTTVSCS